MGGERGALSLALLLGGVNAACMNYQPPPPRHFHRGDRGCAHSGVGGASRAAIHRPHVALRDGRLYGAGVDRKVYAVDLTSGPVDWSQRLSGIIAGGVLVSGDTVFAASSRPDGRVYALDRATGERIWREKTGTVGAPLAMSGGVLLASRPNEGT